MIHLLKELFTLTSLSLFLAEEKYKKEIFIDSSDVIRIIKGHNSLYRYGKFQYSIFKSDRFLVNNLLFSGKLNQTSQILAPHQLELMINIKRKFGLGDKYIDSDDLDRLVTETETFRDESNQKKELSLLSKREKNRILKKVVYLGVSDFKVMMSTQGKSWKDRLSTVFDEKNPLIKLEKEVRSYLELANSDLFRLLYREFEEERNGEDRLNTNDALCLCILQKKVREFNNSPENGTIPLFYDSEGFFNKIIERLGLTEKYTVNIGGDNSHYILRSHNYFVVHCIFCESDFPKSGNTELINHYKKIWEFRTRFLTDYESRNYHSLEKLEEEIKNYRDYNFFKHVMIDYYQSGDFEAVFDSMEIDRSFYNDSLEQALDERIEHLSSEINMNLESLINFQETAISVRKGIVEFRKKMSKLTQINSLRDFGLIRFSLPEEIIDYVDTTLIDVLKLQDYDFIIYDITNKLSQRTDSKEYLSSVVIAWLLELYTLVIDYTSHRKNLKFQLILLRGAAILRNGSKGMEPLQSDLRTLTRLAGPDVSEPDLIKIKLGVSYLHFHIWRSINDPFSLTENTPNSDKQSELAIKLSKRVYLYYNEILEGVRTKVEDLYRLYALNIYIYYTVECGDDISFGQLDFGLIREFIREKSSRGALHWHYRFTDTLARYYHRRYVFDGEQNSDILKMAKDYSREAYETAVLKRDIQDYFGRLILK